LPSLPILSPVVSGTTLVVFYDPANGVILGTDSSIAITDPGQFQTGTITGSGTECKIDSCGRYRTASAGLDVTGGKDVALVCQGFLKRTYGIDDVMRSLELRGVNSATVFVADLIQRKQPPKINQHIFSLAIAGYERGNPVLRYREVRFIGFVQGNAIFKPTLKIACPGSSECDELRIVTGLFEAIERAKENGRYPKTQDPRRLAEALVQIEITAHVKDRLVLPPISVVQMKNGAPDWFIKGLCRE
jgi:hypothetical protein